MEIIDVIQGSPEWLQARCGLVTASRFGDVLAAPSTSRRKTYLKKLLAERDTGQPQEEYKNDAMAMGNETESFAREYYERVTRTKVIQVGFVRDGEVGASPDGLIGLDGMIEIKCPYNSTHLDYIIDDKLPSVYVPQVQGQLWICKRKWCDFVSYAPMCRRPIWIIRVERDEKYIEKLQEAVRTFFDELHTLESKLEEKIAIPF